MFVFVELEGSLSEPKAIVSISRCLHQDVVSVCVIIEHVLCLSSLNIRCYTMTEHLEYFQEVLSYVCD